MNTLISRSRYSVRQCHQKYLDRDIMCIIFTKNISIEILCASMSPKISRSRYFCALLSPKTSRSRYFCAVLSSRLYRSIYFCASLPPRKSINSSALSLSHEVQLGFTHVGEATDRISHSSFVLNPAAGALAWTCPSLVVPEHG